MRLLFLFRRFLRFIAQTFPDTTAILYTAQHTWQWNFTLYCPTALTFSLGSQHRRTVFLVDIRENVQIRIKFPHVFIKNNSIFGQLKLLNELEATLQYFWNYPEAITARSRTVRNSTLTVSAWPNCGKAMTNKSS